MDTLKIDGNNNVKIVKDEFKTIDYRLGMINNAGKISPKYYFATKDGTRISDSFYSIEKLDNIHYLVSGLHFMYSLGFKEFEHLYSNKIIDADSVHFRFHYGVVRLENDIIVQIVPIVYNRILLSNANMLITYGDSAEIVGKRQFAGKMGCINLDIDSEFYGYNIVPPILDRLNHFNLEFKGYAHAQIGDYDGYLSKEIDINKYNKIIELYDSLVKENINYDVYMQKIYEAASLLFFSKSECIERLNESQSSLTNPSKVKLISKN